MKKMIISNVFCLLISFYLKGQSEEIQFLKPGVCDTTTGAITLQEHSKIALREYKIPENGTYQLYAEGNLTPSSSAAKDWWMEFTLTLTCNGRQEQSYNKGQYIKASGANFNLSSEHSITSTFKKGDIVKIHLTIDRSMVDGDRDHQNTILRSKSAICAKKIL